MNRIKNILKNSRTLYMLYNRILSFVLKIIGNFIKTDNSLILFNSFGGTRYDDSPKAIYEYMMNNKKYNNYKMIWAIDNLKLLPMDVKYVKNNSLKFFLLALRAKYWITNSSMERGLKFKKKNTIYINTWHGSAFKLMGNDMKNKITNYDVTMSDYFFCQSKYDVNVFKSAYGYKTDQLPIAGLPRNDELCNVKSDEIKKIKEKLNIPLDKKIILYAPTFREYARDKSGCILAPPINLKKWEDKLGDKYILLFRAHYEVNKVLNIITNDFVYNMTNYPNLNELLKISDIMISDYSSIMIDYSILERPIYSYAYDYDEYEEKRGLYVDLRKELPNGICITEDELLDKILNCNFDEQSKKTKSFKNKYVEVCGNARKFIDKIILKEENE